ncbi:NACHT domain-containing protein [Micromonospora aurantiaca]|uniref:NACHT domain-containing protein n=1 Tax=Micromonospora aurantiaca (nom. illeg.) TaxID=47850 RepID=UPI0033E3C8AA
MSDVTNAHLNLANAVIATASRLWIGASGSIPDPESDAIAEISKRLPDKLQRRRFIRVFDRLADIVAEKLLALSEKDLQYSSGESQDAIFGAVEKGLSGSPLLDRESIDRDLNAAHLAQHVRQRTQHDRSDGATLRVYETVLRDCCEYVVQVFLTLPNFEAGGLNEVLRRDTDIAETLEGVLARLPDRRVTGANDFEVDYRRQVFNRLDRIELFGASLQEASRRYPLSVAYIGLSVSEEVSLSGTAHSEPVLATQIRINQLLSRRKRILLRGEAGGGKTTLLQWIAVRAALRDFPRSLPEWNRLVPFFIPLRRYVGRPLPSPDEFVDEVGRHMREEMPIGWANSLLSRGNAVVLVDGVDELPDRQRASAREWLENLVTLYPGSYFVITSRPGAATSDWLEKSDFQSYELQPMTQHDVRQFVRHWHEAIRSSEPDASEKVKIRQYEDLLAEQIRNHRHLRLLAETPLLCALICALHLDRRGQLPLSRLELYDVALDMLLERRDAERRLATEVNLSRTDKLLILQDISWWFMLNGWSDAQRNQVIERIDAKLQHMPQVYRGAQAVFQHLLERSGILREPLVGRVDFVHRTFQEYLAALGALAVDDVSTLISNAHRDQWREVIVMAAGRAGNRDRRDLIQGILARSDEARRHRSRLTLLAVGCLESSPEISPDLRATIQERASEILPPKNFTAAKAIAAAGDFALDLLANTDPRKAREVAATIRAAAVIGAENGIPLIQRFSTDQRATVIRELMLAWSRFDVEEYALRVLQHSPLGDGYFGLADASLAPGLKYLKNLKELFIVETLNLPSLDFLAELEGLEALWVPTPDDCDLSAVPKYLQALHVHNLTGSALGTIGPLPRLRGLNVTGTSGSINFADFACAANATSLSLNYCTVRSVRDLGNVIPGIRTLSLANSNVSSLDGIEELSGLRELDLSNAQLLDFRSLSELTYLHSLDLSGVRISKIREVASDLGLTRVPFGYPTRHFHENFRRKSPGFVPRWAEIHIQREEVWARPAPG